MRLSPLYIQKIQEAQQIGYEKGRREVKWEFIKMLLIEKVGDIPSELYDRIALLSLAKLPELAKALLRFNSILFQRRYANDDLALWLTNNQ
jgi:hypothetical protein